jgi:mono/diheme cytochrome c family protein
MSLVRMLALVSLPSLLFVGRALCADEAATLFEKEVRPLFASKCFECHSSKADELKGNLKLETVADILKGGDTGPAVVPGDVENSFLLRAIRYQEDDYQMPPRGRLPDDEIAKVEKWVAALKEAAKRQLPPQQVVDGQHVVLEQ